MGRGRYSCIFTLGHEARCRQCLFRAVRTVHVAPTMSCVLVAKLTLSGRLAGKHKRVLASLA